MTSPDISAQSLLLRVAILDTSNVSAGVLKTVIETKPNVAAVTTFSQIDAADYSFRTDASNTLFIDIFTIGPRAGIDFIQHVRKDYPHVPICLYSRSNELTTMPGVNDYWRKRLSHYYNLPKDISVEALDEAVSNALASLRVYLQASIARFKLSDLRSQIARDPESITKENRQATVEAITQAETALAMQTQRTNLPPSIVPGVEFQDVRTIIQDTLRESKKALLWTRAANIAVLVVGGLIVLASVTHGLITGRWESVALGGIGLTAVIAALITSPLKSISATSARQVQIETAYFALLNQLSLLNQVSEKITIMDRSQRLMEIVERTIKVLSDETS